MKLLIPRPGEEQVREFHLECLEEKRKKLAMKSFLAMIEECCLRVDIARMRLLLTIFDKE